MGWFFSTFVLIVSVTFACPSRAPSVCLGVRPSFVESYTQQGPDMKFWFRIETNCARFRYHLFAATSRPRPPRADPGPTPYATMVYARRFSWESQNRIVPKNDIASARITKRVSVNEKDSETWSKIYRMWRCPIRSYTIFRRTTTKGLVESNVSHATIWSDDWRSKSRVSAICMFGMLSIQFAVVLRRRTPTQIEERRSDRFQSYIGRCRTRVWYAGQQEVSRVWMAQATVFHFRMAPPRVLL